MSRTNTHRLTLVPGQSLVVSWSMCYLDPVFRPKELNFRSEPCSIAVEVAGAATHLAVAYPPFAKLSVTEASDNASQ